MSIELDKESKLDEMSDMNSNTIPTEAIDETILEKQRQISCNIQNGKKLCVNVNLYSI